MHPALVGLVKECLYNAPHQRPSTDELLVRLQRMKEEVEREYGSGVVKLDVMSKMKLFKELKTKSRDITVLKHKKVMATVIKIVIRLTVHTSGNL